MRRRTLAASGRLAARCAQVPLRSQLAAAAAVGNTVSSAERHIIIVEQRQQYSDDAGNDVY
jgi:hypothetical protein